MALTHFQGGDVEVDNRPVMAEEKFSEGNGATAPTDTLGSQEAGIPATAETSSRGGGTKRGRRPRRECGRGRR